MQRRTQLLKYGFRFHKFDVDADISAALIPDFDDSDWSEVRVPHDWAIDGEFRAEYDANESTIKADGIEKPILLTGRTGALPSIGCGVYRKWLHVPQGDEHISLVLDGVMWESEVYLNGARIGGCHFGYKSYEVDLTRAVKRGEENLLCVVAKVFRDCSRWYTGGGIYRHMYLVSKPEVHIEYNGVWVRQLCAGPSHARFEVSAQTVGADVFSAEVFSTDGALIASGQSERGAFIFEIDSPHLWDVDDPHLYSVKVSLDSGDSETVRFGARSSRFTPEGYFLNGRRLKINGVCLHHDLGSLGSAVNTAAIRRQLTILRGMGVNAVRTSHNPPAPELLCACDEMGFLVMDEIFDEWSSAKVQNGYAKYFDAHAVTDACDVIRRDRNHPSIILWSVGNEMLEQWNDDGWYFTKLLTDAVREKDPTRPVTAGFSAFPHSENNSMLFYTDVVGINYQPYLYRTFREKYPDMIMFGSETASCISTRGVYRLPARVEIPAEPYDDLAVSAYELCAPGWAYCAERELAYQRDCPYVAGEFIWTGFDYLGEPTPYYGAWPSRSSYFGAVDLAGLPKNRYYCYKAAWTDEGVLHIFPHWNWEGHEGQNVPVHIYTNFPEAELFINGVSQGRRTLDAADELKRFRMMWEDTVYQPGQLLAVAYDKDGNEAMRACVKTAGAPCAVTLEADRKFLACDGDDLCYITASIVDSEGNVCHTACDRLAFSVTGAGELLTTDAGDQRETEPFTRPDKKALSGKLVACVRSLPGVSGMINIKCGGAGLEPCTLQVEVK